MRLRYKISNLINHIFRKDDYYKYLQNPVNNAMIPHENKNEARNPLKEEIMWARTLLINDPYFFSAPSDISDIEYVDAILETLPLRTLTKITIVHKKPKKGDFAINLFEQAIPKNIEVNRVIDDSVHDRVWLIDEVKAFSVGTSIGGIGYRLSFILPLPEEDVAEFKSWIKQVLDKHKNG